MDVACSVSRKEKPILFNTEMVRAILDGRKTQTRRPIKIELGLADTDKNDPSYLKIPDIYGDYWDAKDLCRYQPGDILWVRETWAWLSSWNCESREAGYCKGCTQTYKGEFGCFRYKAVDGSEWTGGWKPSIHMPRKAARLFLEVTDVRVERVQDITDIKAEGLVNDDKEVYAALWDSIYAEKGYGWDIDPWVWVIGFTVLKHNG